MRIKVAVLELSALLSVSVWLASSVQPVFARNSPKDIAISRCVIQALRRYPAAVSGKRQLRSVVHQIKLAWRRLGSMRDSRSPRPKALQYR